MKQFRLFLALFVSLTITNAQSNHTITIDGTNDFTASENFSTSTSGWTDYFTWDATNLYFGISGADVDTDGKVSFIYIDIDPTGSNGSTSSINWNRNHTLPFNADWAFAYKAQSGADYWNLRNYSGGAWLADQTFNGSVSLGSDFLEVSIPKADIGTPTEIKIVIFVQNNDGSWTWSSAPSNAITDGAGDKTFSHYLGYTLADGYTPNNTNALDYVMRKNSAYLSFDGTDDYVRYANDATLQRMDAATNYTIEAWIYPTNAVDETDRVLQRYYSFNIQMYDGDDNGTVNDWYFVVIDGSGNNHYFNTEGDATLTLNAWNHIAVINNSTSGTLKLYVNGEDVTATGGYANYSLRAAQASDNLFVGNSGGGAGYFDGSIDEVRIKNVAVAPADLHTTIGANAYMSDANTAALFHFDEGTGSVTTNYASLVTARLGSATIGDAAEPTWITNVTTLPLPVELTSFNALTTSNGILLNWQTATEVNNYGFEVERAIVDSELRISEFTKIGFVEGHGNSNSTKNYSFTDNLVTTGKYSYRLKQIDIDGKFEYSDVVLVTLNQNIPNNFELSQNYPNPFNPTTEINFSIPTNENVSIIVFNLLGEEVAQVINKELLAGSHKIQFDASKLSSGIYFYKMVSGKFVSVKKMILMK